jgi:cold shock CspA family protein
MLGRVKNIKPSLYGFILDEEGKEYFFHAQNYNGDWEELKLISPPITTKGPIVQFTPVNGPKGLKAEKVEFVGDF